MRVSVCAERANTTYLSGDTLLSLAQEGKVDAVKVEGGTNRAEHIRKIVDGGIAVVGHVGLTPQAIRYGRLSHPRYWRESAWFCRFHLKDLLVHTWNRTMSY